MRVCTKCKKTKTETEYFYKDKRQGRLHSQCKDCYRAHRKTYHKQHYEKYGDAYRKRARERKIKARQEYRTNMLNYLRDKRCVICGEPDPVVLEMDHIEPKDKQFSISQAVKFGYSWGEIAKELKKCRVLCANCHKRHTAKQFGWYKS